MSDIETRLRETLQTVSDRTRATRRQAAFADRRRTPSPAWAVLAGIGIVVLLVGAPVLYFGRGGQQPSAQPQVGSDSTPDGIADPGWAVDPGWLTMDQGDLDVMAMIAAEYYPAPHWPDGFRQPLKSETIWCLYRGTDGATASASAFALDSDLTLAHLEQACTSGNDGVPAVAPSSFTICRGVYAAASYENLLQPGGPATSGRGAEGILTAGSPSGALPGFPVVLGWESDCDSEDLSTNPEVRLTSDLDLEAINRVRRVEIALWGASYDNCFTYTQAHSVADAARATLGDNWLRLDIPAAARAGTCFQPVIDLDWGWITVYGRHYPQLGLQGEALEEPDSTVTTLRP